MQIVDVTSQLEAHRKKFKSIEVARVIPVDLDLGNLAAFDVNPLDQVQLQSKTESYLQSYVRDGVQLIVNELFKLPFDSTEDGPMVKLPSCKLVIPREKPVPKPKPLTRWEKFAKEKGITKKKKSKMSFDEQTGEYKPTFGYKSANFEKENQWLVEIPQNADPMEDQFAKMREEKKERVEKNKKQQRRNKDEAQAKAAGKNPREARKQQLKEKLLTTKKSTASMGKFDPQLKNEPKLKSGEKRKFQPTIVDSKKEKEANMNILQRVVGKDGVTPGKQLMNKKPKSK